MRLSRQPRLIAALVALISMLFMQLAVAAYACPSQQMGHVAESVSMPAQAHDEMPGCEGADINASALCHAHCQPDTQSLDKPQSPDVSPFLALALVSTVIDTAFSYPPVSTHRDDRLLRRVISPPLSIRNCCFRI
jgi:hypothetical protein